MGGVLIMIRFEMYEIDPSDIPVRSGKSGVGKSAYIDDIIDHFRRSSMEAAEIRGGISVGPSSR